MPVNHPSGRRYFLAALAGAAWLAGTASGQAAATRPLTVVELFTSQGCSSCPPANANLARISDEPGILALSFGVTYWDYLGWKDRFARPDYTARQQAYEPPLGQDGPFTPQMVVNGRVSLVGQNLADVRVALRKGAAPEGGARPVLALDRSGVQVSGTGAGPADVWLVRYDRRLVEVPVTRGENRGRTLPHKNVVHDLVRLGRWSGAPARFALPPATPGQNTAILLQSPHGGPILAAITD